MLPSCSVSRLGALLAALAITGLGLAMVALSLLVTWDAPSGAADDVAPVSPASPTRPTAADSGRTALSREGAYGGTGIGPVGTGGLL